MLIPREILSDDEKTKVYDLYKDNPVELEKRFKWWSLHDLMAYFKSGLLPKENDANIFSFKIDLTAPELAANSARNPQLLSGLNTAMANLQKITNQIASEFTKQQTESSSAQAQIAMGNVRRPIGGKKGQTKKYKNKKGGGFNAEDLFGANILKTECLNDLAMDNFSSRDRIFIIDGLLPVAPKNLIAQIAEPVPAPPMPGAMPGAAPPMPGAMPGVNPLQALNANLVQQQVAAPPMSVGGKTRKGYRRQKKSKTRRRHYHRRS
jgi:hypothetical protein